MRRTVDPAADLGEFIRLVATEVALRVAEGDKREASDIGRDVLMEIPSFPKLGRQIHILRRRIAARRVTPGRPAACFP